MDVTFTLREGCNFHKVYNKGYYSGLLMPHGSGFVYVKNGKFKAMKSTTLSDAMKEVVKIV